MMHQIAESSAQKASRAISIDSLYDFRDWSAEVIYAQVIRFPRMRLCIYILYVGRENLAPGSVLIKYCI